MRTSSRATAASGSALVQRAGAAADDLAIDFSVDRALLGSESTQVMWVAERAGVLTVGVAAARPSV